MAGGRNSGPEWITGAKTGGALSKSASMTSGVIPDALGNTATPQLIGQVQFAPCDPQHPMPLPQHAFVCARGAVWQCSLAEPAAFSTCIGVDGADIVAMGDIE